MSYISDKKAEQYLLISSQFKLGKLVTESAHSSTKELSNLAVNNLPEAVSVLKEIDKHTIGVLYEKRKEILRLKEIISDTLTSGNNIFLCGCGLQEGYLLQ